MDMATSTVPRVPGIDLEEYKSVLRFRFSNLSDDLSRLAQDGSKKMVGFVLPSLEIRLEKKQSTENRYCCCVLGALLDQACKRCR